MPAVFLIVLLAICVIAALAYVRNRRSSDDEFLWRMESIRASVVRADNIIFGQYLNLDQQLRPGEGGWTNMKIAIPDTWEVATVMASGDRVFLSLGDGSRYSLGRDNIGELSFRILDGGPGKSDEILEQIWNTYAREQKA